MNKTGLPVAILARVYFVFCIGFPPADAVLFPTMCLRQEITFFPAAFSIHNPDSFV